MKKLPDPSAVGLPVGNGQRHSLSIGSCGAARKNAVKSGIEKCLIFISANDIKDESLTTTSKRRDRSKRLAHCKFCDKNLCDSTEYYRHANHFHKVRLWLQILWQEPLRFNRVLPSRKPFSQGEIKKAMISLQGMADFLANICVVYRCVHPFHDSAHL